MVNKDRVVPVQNVDFLSLIGTVLTLIGTSYSVLESPDVEGNFVSAATGSVGNVLCNQPVKSLALAAGATSATVYFVCDYDFQGIKVGTSDATLASASLSYAALAKDGITLYKAVLATGEITISAVTPIV